MISTYSRDGILRASHNHHKKNPWKLNISN